MNLPMNKARGFSLAELIIVIIIIGVLAAIIIPRIPLYSTRQDVISVLDRVGEVKMAVAREYDEFKTMPANNKAANLPEPNARFGNNISSLVVTDGEIAVTLKDMDDESLNGVSVLLTPRVLEGRIEWSCRVTDSDFVSYMPAYCRD